MMGFITLLCWFGILLPQDPDPALIRKLDAVEPGTRLAAAEDLAKLGPSVEKWLHKKVGSGSASRQRSLMLTAALLATDESWELIEKEARRGRRPEASRAYALLLYGAFHPEAGKDAAKDWRRADSDFESSCLLAGLLAREEALDLDGFHAIVDRKGTDRQQSLLAMLDSLHGRAANVDGEAGIVRGFQLLSTLIAGPQLVAAADTNDMGEGLPEIWAMAALRQPGRDLDALKGLPLGGESGAVCFALREIDMDQRQAAFNFMNQRITADPAASWLWGEAGDLGLDLGRPVETELTAAEMAGLLRLALRNFESAEELAKLRVLAARAALTGRADDPKERWLAALMLALAGDAEDHPWFKQALENGTAEGRSKLQPLWLLASRKLDPGVARSNWLSNWSREFGAGSVGFLDREGPRWVALSLVSGTLAARENGNLQGFEEHFKGKLDHPLTDEFYADLATFLTSSHYRFHLR
jgi:hypothetical protein